MDEPHKQRTLYTFTSFSHFSPGSVMGLFSKKDSHPPILGPKDEQAGTDKTRRLMEVEDNMEQEREPNLVAYV